MLAILLLFVLLSLCNKLGFDESLENNVGIRRVCEG